MLGDDLLPGPSTPKQTPPSIHWNRKKSASDPRSSNGVQDLGMSSEHPTTPRVRIHAARGNSAKIRRPRHVNLSCEESSDREVVADRRKQSSEPALEGGTPSMEEAARHPEVETAASKGEAIVNNSEVASSAWTEQLGTSEFLYMSRCLETIMQRLDTNLKYTKAVYRGTKKSLTGPGFETSSVFSLGDRLLRHRDSNSSRYFAAPVPPILVASPQCVSESSSATGKTLGVGKTDSFNSSHRADALARDQVRYVQATAMNEPSIVWSRSVSFDQILDPNTFGGNQIGGQADTHQLQTLPKEAGEYEDSCECQIDRHADNPQLQTLPDLSCECESTRTTGTLRAQPASMHEVTRFLAQHNRYHELRTAKIWRFMEDRTSSRSACCYFHGRMLLIALSVAFACFQVVEVSHSGQWKAKTDGIQGFAIQLFFEALFALELSVRFYVCPSRLLFLLSLYNIIDFISILPCAMRFPVFIGMNESSLIVAFFGIVPVLRLLKVLRHFETFHLLLSAFMSAVEAMPMVLFILFLIASTFASVIYYCEDRENLPSLPLALYFCIVTLSTVGYGDFVPESTSGRVWTIALAVLGPMYMAIPIGIIGRAFSEGWEDRHRLSVLHRMRTRLTNAGYTAQDLKNMFKLMDRNEDNTLDYDEFIALLEIMEINVSDRFIRQVFASLDTDDTGSICLMELLRGLFPHTHRRLSLTMLRSNSLALDADDGGKKT